VEAFRPTFLRYPYCQKNTMFRILRLNAESQSGFFQPQERDSARPTGSATGMSFTAGGSGIDFRYVHDVVKSASEITLEVKIGIPSVQDAGYKQ